MTETTPFLDRVYELDSAEKVPGFYDDWAASYEAEVAAQGYASPRRCAEALAAHASDPAAPVLDVGCGTGLSGAALAAAGFGVIDGTDFSAGMLDVARGKGVYRTLIQGDAAAPLPGEAGAYANIAAVGVFSPSHAPASLIDAALAHLAPGGCLVFTLNDHALEDPSYEGRVMEAADTGWAEFLVKERGDHLPGIGLQSTVYLLRRR